MAHVFVIEPVYSMPVIIIIISNISVFAMDFFNYHPFKALAASYQSYG